MANSEIKDAIRALAAAQGFVLCRITRAGFPDKHRHGLEYWLSQSMHGEMDYMAEEGRVMRRKSPESMLAEVRSVITLAMRHTPPPYSLEETESDKGRGVIAAYAHGDDYHDIMKKRLKALARDLDTLLGEHDQRVYVDTAPVLEHALAEEAGLGWQGKHTLTINRQHGSYLVLGELFTTAEIEPDEPAPFHCGSCTACIDTCPTKAIVAPFVVDARRCISYLTIEYRGYIPHELRPLIGNRIFGCDDCQMICPWNGKAEPVTLNHLQPREGNLLPELAELFALDDEGFRARFRKSPIKRTGRAGLLRNVAVAMGNSGDCNYIPQLLDAMNDSEPLIRGHSAWAVAHLLKQNPGQNPQSSNGEIIKKLEYHALHETDAGVLQELHLAIERLGERS